VQMKTPARNGPSARRTPRAYNEGKEFLGTSAYLQQRWSTCTRNPATVGRCRAPRERLARLHQTWSFRERAEWFFAKFGIGDVVRGDQLRRPRFLPILGTATGDWEIPWTTWAGR